MAKEEVWKRREGAGGKEVTGSPKEASGGQGRPRRNMKASLLACVDVSMPLLPGTASAC